MDVFWKSGTSGCDEGCLGMHLQAEGNEHRTQLLGAATRYLLGTLMCHGTHTSPR